MLKIRLTRLGDKKSPFYRVVVADSRSPRDGKVVATLGTFDPLHDGGKGETKVDAAQVREWIAKGAIPTETARAVLVKAGAIEAVPYKEKKMPVEKKETKKQAKK